MARWIIATIVLISWLLQTRSCSIGEVDRSGSKTRLTLDRNDISYEISHLLTCIRRRLLILSERAIKLNSLVLAIDKDNFSLIGISLGMVLTSPCLQCQPDESICVCVCVDQVLPHFI